MTFDFDGLRDRETNLLTPAAFYDSFLRLLSSAGRDSGTLFLMKFIIATDQEVINFAQVLAENSRSDDLVARMGEREFLVVLRNSLTTDTYLNRLRNSLTNSSTPMRDSEAKFAHLELVQKVMVNLTAQALFHLNELDRRELHPLSLKPTM